MRAAEPPSSGDCGQVPDPSSELWKRRSILRLQHLLKRERPTGTERKSLKKSADGRMASEAARLRAKDQINARKRKNHLD
jgi:hypothetical protein